MKKRKEYDQDFSHLEAILDQVYDNADAACLHPVCGACIEIAKLKILLLIARRLDKE